MVKEILLPLGIFGSVVYIGNKFFKDETDHTDDTVTDAEKDVKKSNLSYKVSWYSQAADTIQQSLLTVWKWGDTGNKEIGRVLLKLTSLKNVDDWNMLVAKFGKRSGVGVSIVYKETLIKWLIFFLEGKTYYFYKSGKKHKVDALYAARYILKNRKVII